MACRKVARRSAAALALAFVLGASCVPQPSGAEERLRPDPLPPLSAYAGQAIPEPSPWLPLVGRVDFSPAELAPMQRIWFERLWGAIERSRDAMVARVGRDDVYDFGRWLFQYNAGLLTAFRVTGDLRLLDEVDVVTEAMRRQLRDGWCDGVHQSVEVNVRYGRVSEPDGFRNFRLRQGPGRDNCRDTGDLNETLTHGHLAMVMYAFHANRHLESPGGVDYGERADFWLTYLRDDFEAKWRMRSGTTWPEMDFIDAKFCHTYAQMLLYYQFIGLRLQADASPDAGPYLRQVIRLSDAMFEVPYVPGRQPGGFVDVATPLGPAVIYSFGPPGRERAGAVHMEACPTTYARYMLTSILALRMEGVSRWDDAMLSRLAGGLAHFVVDPVQGDDAPLSFASGVSGRTDVAGMPPPTDRSAFTAADFVLTPFAAYSAWEAGDELELASLAAYASVERHVDQPDHVYIPAGMLLAVTVRAGSD